MDLRARKKLLLPAKKAGLPPATNSVPRALTKPVTAVAESGCALQLDDHVALLGLVGSTNLLSRRTGEAPHCTHAAASMKTAAHARRPVRASGTHIAACTSAAPCKGSRPSRSASEAKKQQRVSEGSG